MKPLSCESVHQRKTPKSSQDFISLSIKQGETTQVYKGETFIASSIVTEVCYIVGCHTFDKVHICQVSLHCYLSSTYAALVSVQLQGHRIVFTEHYSEPLRDMCILYWLVSNTTFMLTTDNHNLVRNQINKRCTFRSRALYLFHIISSFRLVCCQSVITMLSHQVTWAGGHGHTLPFE